jgi:hypothetical protein
MQYRLLEELDDDIYVFSEGGNVKHSLTPEILEGIAWALLGAFVIRLSGIEELADQARARLKLVFRFAQNNKLEKESTDQLQNEAESRLNALSSDRLGEDALVNTEYLLASMLRDEGLDLSSAERIAAKLRKSVSDSVDTNDNSS